MPKLTLPDVSLHYEISGEGPPLLMIAGMMSDSASWAPLLPLLEPHFTLIRPDMRTTGQTTPWDAPASVDIFASDCAALLDHLGHDNAHVLGHSLGGIIGTRLAINAPARVKTLTLLASAPIRLERNSAIFKTLLAIRDSNAPEETWLNALFPWLFAPPFFEMLGAVDQAIAASLAYPHSQSAKAMAHQLGALTSYEPDDPNNLLCPAQAVLGEVDLLMPLPQTQAALGPIPHHIVMNAGHSIHWDAPEAVARHLISFVEDHNAT